MEKSKVKTATEKISDGTIKIENGKLIGLGHGNDSINIKALDDFLFNFSKNEVIRTLSHTITGIGRTISYLAIDHSELLDSHVNFMLPEEHHLYKLNEILNLFNE
ncbi:hypothetical protein ACUNWD_10025 [Sunxiuqinia sp. A32]|uniref:hypothetical protein n=1 Tax=Sunxiuqinia sp. A32 TaxID=3461496 RepID=UPI004046257B